MKRNRVRLTESQLHRVIKESVKKVLKEVNGWSLEDDDICLVNTEDDGDDLYMVKLWWGATYRMDVYNVYAFHEEDALEKVVAWIEQNHPSLLEDSDECAEGLLQDLQDKGMSLGDAEISGEFEDSFMYVDATMEGAREPHYVWAEDLTIVKYPKQHNYPMSSSIKR